MNQRTDLLNIAEDLLLFLLFRETPGYLVSLRIPGGRGRKLDLGGN
jgi:hypothetical protein